MEGRKKRERKKKQKMGVNENIRTGCPRIIRTYVFCRILLRHGNRQTYGRETYRVSLPATELKHHTNQRSVHDRGQLLGQVNGGY